MCVLSEKDLRIRQGIEKAIGKEEKDGRYFYKKTHFQAGENKSKAGLGKVLRHNVLSWNHVVKNYFSTLRKVLVYLLTFSCSLFSTVMRNSYHVWIYSAGSVSITVLHSKRKLWKIIWFISLSVCNFESAHVVLQSWENRWSVLNNMIAIVLHGSC